MPVNDVDSLQFAIYSNWCWTTTLYAHNKIGSQSKILYNIIKTDLSTHTHNTHSLQHKCVELSEHDLLVFKMELIIHLSIFEKTKTIYASHLENGFHRNKVSSSMRIFVIKSTFKPFNYGRKHAPKKGFWDENFFFSEWVFEERVNCERKFCWGRGDILRL